MEQPSKDFVTVTLKKVQWDAVVSVIEPEYHRQGKNWIQWGKYVKDTIQASTNKVASSDDLVPIILSKDSWKSVVFLIKTNCSQRGKEWKIFGDNISQRIQQTIENAISDSPKTPSNLPLENKYGDGKEAKPKPEKPAPAGSQTSTYEWTYFDNKAAGIRLPYPKNWVVDQQPDGKIIIRAANTRMIAGGILELGMTLVVMDTSRSPMASADDMTICKKFTDVMMTNAGGVVDWREEGKLTSGQPVLWFEYGFRKTGVGLKAVCAVAHKHGSLYYLDVTGLAGLIDARIDEWKSIAHALEIRK